MITYSDLLGLYHAEAIANTLEPTDLAHHRMICRAYSKTFHTPLNEVLAMDPAEVILAYYENELEAFDQDEHLEQLLDLIYTLEDPAYERQKKDDMDEFDAQAEREEEERVKAGKPIHPALKKEASLEDVSEPHAVKMLPKSGGINLSYLAKEEEES